MRRTKIIASLGPSLGNAETLRKVLPLVDGLRINFSHGSPDQWALWVRAVRELGMVMSHDVPLIGDLRGPSVRTSPFTARMAVRRGDEVCLSWEGGGCIAVPHEEFFDVLEPGDTVVTDDGRLSMAVIGVGRRRATLVARTDGEIGPNKALVVRGKEYPFEVPTEKDVADMRFAVEQGLDMVAVSYVRTSRDVDAYRKLAEEVGFTGPLMVKIETASSVNNIADILGVSDYVVVARGDLGLHVGLEQVPRVQRTIVEQAIRRGVPVAVATQIFESMMRSPVPTRAEVTDVYMAVMEGVDALMLTGETAVGTYPVEAVEWLNKVVAEAENMAIRVPKAEESRDIRDLFVKGLVQLAENIGAKILVYTVSGTTGRRIAKFRPVSPTYVATPDPRVARMLRVYWSLSPMVIEASDRREGMRRLLETARREGRIVEGDIAVLTYGLQREERHIIEIINIREDGHRHDDENSFKGY